MIVSGDKIYDLSKKLFPITRSITGNGVRESFEIIKQILPELILHEVKTGENYFDWTVPDEWNIDEGYIETLSGERIIDFRENNLHILNYSEPVNQIMDREELFDHIFTRPDMPDAIPYATSYYKRRWGFCMSESQREMMQEDRYRVVIRSKIERGSLTYGDILVPGETQDEILVHTYTCHPSMGNNETSGLAVTAYLARSILDMPTRRYSYRIVFVPETIGAIIYIARNLEHLRQHVKAGFILTCVGDNRTWSLMPSREDGTLPERAARHILEYDLKVPYTRYSFLDRGSDERQYCAPGVDLPVASIMRSKYGTYPEYHTSLDNMSLICPEGLWGGYSATLKAISAIEANCLYTATVLCEPFMSKRGLRPPLERGRDLGKWSAQLSNVLAYSDGRRDLLSIAEILNCSIFELLPAVETLQEHGLIETA